mmetsp:Transcript_17526/g.20078  ORF Transcript_17526/g.20078 Transcript_17526/m.20078 type:complete len:140 (+) Transcript_17526:638-1057(+)
MSCHVLIVTMVSFSVEGTQNPPLYYCYCWWPLIGDPSPPRQKPSKSNNNKIDPLFGGGKLFILLLVVLCIAFCHRDFVVVCLVRGVLAPHFISNLLVDIPGRTGTVISENEMDDIYFSIVCRCVASRCSCEFRKVTVFI